jgi:hypothetical protein
MNMLIICWLSMLVFVTGYPLESKPLKNSPDSWNFGAENLEWDASNGSNPSASALTSDPHVKKSKITPKSIFIAPNSNVNSVVCPNGFRVDENGKCIKTVFINQGNDS